MSQIDPKDPVDMEAVKASVFERLESEGEMDGLSKEDLADAMSHPMASEVVAELIPLEATSVQQGEPAREFELPFLPGHGAGETLRLSDRFAERPVALIFGSYT